MRKYLNTLFVTIPGAYLNKEGETIVVSVEKETKLQVPIHALGGVVCFGQIGMSPQLMAFCAESGVAVSFLSEYGRFWGSVRGEVCGNVLLRREQYRRADDEKAGIALAKAFLTGKFYNGRSVLERALRDHGGKLDVAAVGGASSRLKYAIGQLERGWSLDGLRGLEGDTAHAYFSVFNHLIIAQKDGFWFDERNRRPPLDSVNCLLSFLYTLVMHDVRSALETVGLDPYVGFLHRDRPGRVGLALDMMEEFRPFLADRLALSLINREQVAAKGFRSSGTGAVLMDDETRKTVLVAYQKRKQEEIEHPFLKETVPVGLLFFLQALLLARHLRGDLDGYPVFLWR